MTYAQIAPATMTRGSSRWLLLGSLALNLFFVGVAFAMAIRAPAQPTWDRNVFVRVERVAASLPPLDADLLRGQIKTNRPAIEDAQANYRAAQDVIRGTLRQDPFDADAMRAAMAKTRTARQNFDQTIQSVFAGAASQMSSAGRHALADWPPDRKSSSNQQ
jgi:uncharacterized membrane protein